MLSPELRAADVDRRRVVADLQRHYADGRLTTEELRERIGQAMTARTYADLDGLQRDLPAIELAPRPTAAVCNTSPTPAQCRQGFRAHALFYLLVMSGLVILWLLTSPGGYFWPVWPMFGWGIGLASHGIAYRLSKGNTPELAAS